MKILHHYDDDGRCAGAIIYTTFTNPMNVNECDLIQYNYGQDLEEMTKELEFHPTETVYIVDISLNKDVMNFIKKAYHAGCNIVHLDHHESTFEMMSSLTHEEKVMMDSNRVFYMHNRSISGCMLSYVYACLHDDERKNSESFTYDFTEDYSHLVIIDTNNTKISREYGIPMAVRYIDDNDTFRNKMVETKYFSLGFSMVDKKMPDDEIWIELLYGTNYSVISNYIDTGEQLYKYMEHQNRILMKNSFVTQIEGLDVLCVNACVGNSRIFGEEFDKYPACCKFGYDGKIHKWRYTLYGSDAIDPDKKNDLTKIAKIYGGGGHKHACGFTLDYNLFDMEAINK